MGSAVHRGRLREQRDRRSSLSSERRAAAVAPRGAAFARGLEQNLRWHHPSGHEPLRNGVSLGAAGARP
jgi:hypothetical protein